jgi:RNA polymerase sigma factor (sigma-70 family)
MAVEASGFRQLLAKARAGDETATGRLLALVRDHLARTAGKYEDRRQAVESASDLVQDASLKLWQHLHEFRGGATDEESLSKFLVWSEQIVSRLGLNAFRDRSTQRRRPEGPVQRLSQQSSDESDCHRSAEPVATEATPSTNARFREEAAAIKDAVDRLTDDLDRELLRLRFFEGHSMRQIAEMVPLSYDQIRDRFQAIMRRLARDLEGLL